MTMEDRERSGAAVEDVAERQDGVVSVEAALATGLSMGQISRRRKKGRYRRCRRGVVQIAGVPPSWRQAVRIASIAAGGEVVVSHASAVRLYGLELPRCTHLRWTRDNAFVEVEAPIDRHVRLDGVRGHRSYTWQPGDVRRVAGMAVTSPLRTVIDLSSRLGVDGTGKLVDQMLRKGLLKAAELRDRVMELRPAPGRSVRVLRSVAAARGTSWDAGESVLEARLRRVIQRKRFPSPVGQHWVRDGDFSVRLDFAYPDVKVYLEGDGFGFHRFASDLDRDVRKRNGLLRRGWIGLHLTARMTDAEIENDLASLYDRATQSWRLPR
ncbi:MAG: type IV toxin-antitoxin system AbiEi family antitoxin domain-containing protein [Ilumatobacteraceae bacterium]